jgi:predicted enzyme related to lactoylglutathione lyase
MSRPIHFEIPTQNAERAQAFYARLFGWKFSKWDGPMEYWLISTGEGPGIDGGMMVRPGTVTNTMNVDSLADSIRLVSEMGGEIVLPPQPIEGVGTVAYARDPDGNIFGMMEPLRNA